MNKNNKHEKDIKLAFYIVSGVLLGVPFLSKIIKILPEILKVIPNLAEILSAYGYAILVVASLIAAYKLGAEKWLKIIGIYSSAGIVLGALSVVFNMFEIENIFELLFSIYCAPFVGVDSDFAVIAVMVIITVLAYALMGKLPKEEKPAENNTAEEK